MVQGEQSQLVYEPDILYRYNQLGLPINYSWLTIDYRYILLSSINWSVNQFTSEFSPFVKFRQPWWKQQSVDCQNLASGKAAVWSLFNFKV